MNKKIIFVGDLKYDIYEKSLGDGFKKIDYDVYFFKSENCISYGIEMEAWI